MKLEEMKRIAEARTKGEWCQEALGETDGRTLYVDNGKPNYEDWPTLAEDMPGEDAEFIALAANTYDQLLKIAECAKDLMGSTGKVYQGFPGKLEWPELHYLKQALEELEK